MVSPYNNPNAYIQSGMPIYEEQQQSKVSAVPTGIAGAVVGAVGGGVIGNKQNPYMKKNNLPTDMFVSKVHSKLLEHAGSDAKEIYENTLKVIKDLDNIKTVEELQALKTNNPKIITTNLDNIKPENLAENIKTLKNSLIAHNNIEIQNTKNIISTFWNKESKTFVKSENILSEETFNIVKDSTKGLKAKVVAKYAGIGAAITGVLAFLAHKLLTLKPKVQNNSQQI